LLILIALSKADTAMAAEYPVTILAVSDMSVPGHTRVVLQLSDIPEFTQDKLRNPDRFYIDLKDTTVPKRLRKQLSMNGLVKAVRVAQFNPKTARAVFDLRDPACERNVSISQNPLGIDVEFIERRDRKRIPLSEPLAANSRNTQSPNSFLTQAVSPPSVDGEAPDQASYEEGFKAEMAGQWAKALKNYMAVVEREPKRMDVWLRIADIESSLGNQAAAADALERAVQLSPDDDRLRFRLSQTYSVSNRPKKALESLQRAVELAPANVEYLKALGQLANWNGRSDLAASAYRRLVALSPDNDAALHDLAKSEMWSGDLDKAAKDFDTYTRKHPEDKEAIIEYAEAEGWRGNYARGLDILATYKSKFGETREYRKTRARLLAWAHRPTEALELLQPLLKEAPDDYEFNYSRTLSLRYANRPEEMIESLDKTEGLRPDSKESTDLRLFTTADFRSNIEAAFGIYADSDHLSTYATSLTGSYLPRPDTSIRAGVQYKFLHAKAGSGLEKVDGGTSENYLHGWIAFDHRISPQVAFEGDIGSASAEGQSTIVTYYLALTLQPLDSLALKVERNHDFYLVSPRTVSQEITEGLNRIKATWQASLLYTFDTNVTYSTLSDDNSFWQIFFGPRRSFLRSAKFNLDVGLNGSWLSFEKQLNNGYYSPELYQKYGISEFGYWKINDENGVSIVMSQGALKDETMSGFRLGFDAYVEGTFGIYRDWMFKVTGSVSQNLRQATGAFRAYAAGFSITHRF
jgi:tetratricopeptide (TPR) repeat protein